MKVTKGLCRVFEGYPNQGLKIELSKSGERFDITVSDPETEVDFLPPIHMTGDKIEEDSSPPGSKRFIVYRVKIKETIVVSSKRDCEDYPTENYPSFNSCVQNEFGKRVASALGCMLPIISDQNQCTGLIPR